MSAIAARVKGRYAGAYGGAKFGPATAQEALIGELQGSSMEAASALSRFGYRSKRWGLEVEHWSALEAARDRGA